MRLSLRTKLLSGAAAVGLLVAIDSTNARAQWAHPGAISLFVEGGNVNGSSTINNTTYADLSNGAGGATGTSYTVNAGDGFIGRIGGGYQITDRFSARLAYTGLRANSHSQTPHFATSRVYTVLGTGSSSGVRAVVSTHTTVDIVDFQVGYDVGLGNIDIGGIGGDIQATLLGGLRYGDFSQRINAVFPFSGSGQETDLRNSTFRGGGPTIGATVTLPIGYGFAIENSILGGLLVGELTSNTQQDNFQGRHTTKHGVAGTFDGQLALTYTIPTLPSVQFAAGYQVSY